MKRHVLAIALALCPVLPLVAQEVGTASGKGTLERSIPGSKSAALKEAYETVSFSPRFSFASREGKGAEAETWIVLTEKQPPVKDWLASKDQINMLRLWCGKEKASFAAMSLDSKMAVGYYFLCPGNGQVTSEGVNVANGLESIVLKFQTRDAKRLKATLRTGQGNCSKSDGPQVYCKPTGDFTFDAPILR
jgi:hypothetical protein